MGHDAPGFLPQPIGHVSRFPTSLTIRHPRLLTFPSNRQVDPTGGRPRAPGAAGAAPAGDARS